MPRPQTIIFLLVLAAVAYYAYKRLTPEIAVEEVTPPPPPGEGGGGVLPLPG